MDQCEMMVNTNPKIRTIILIIPPGGLNQDAINYGYRELAAAIFRQAVIDFQDPNSNPETREDARRWLDRYGYEYLDMIGADIEKRKYLAWKAAGYPASLWRLKVLGR